MAIPTAEVTGLSICTIPIVSSNRAVRKMTTTHCAKPRRRRRRHHVVELDGTDDSTKLKHGAIDVEPVALHDLLGCAEVRARCRRVDQQRAAVLRRPGSRCPCGQ
jgi:hypothetical protein